MQKLIIPLIVLNFFLFIAILKPKNQAAAGQPAQPKQNDNHEVEKPVSPKTEPKWVKWDKKREMGNDLFSDVLSHVHSRSPMYFNAGRNTDAHENNHLVEGDIRNAYYQDYFKKDPKANIGGFYVGGDRALVLKNPAFRLGHVAEMVPSKLRYSRYKMYLVDQRSQPTLDASPLYIWNEWNCYVMGFAVDVEDAENGRARTTASDYIASLSEFTMYSMCVGLACEKYDPDYFKNNPDAKMFLIWNAERAQNLIKRSRKFKSLQWDTDLNAVFRDSSDANPIREFMTNKLGMNIKEFFKE